LAECLSYVQDVRGSNPLVPKTSFFYYKREGMSDKDLVVKFKEVNAVANDLIRQHHAKKKLECSPAEISMFKWFVKAKFRCTSKESKNIFDLLSRKINAQLGISI
jgi:hypothetical protein